MADTEEEVQTEAKPKKSGMSTMTLIGVIAGVVALQAIIIFAIFKFGFSSSGDKEKESEPKKSASSKHIAPEPDEEGDLVIREVGKIIETEDMVINTRNSKSNYLMVRLGLEIDPDANEEEVKNKLMTPISDKAISLFSSYTTEELQRATLRDSLKLELKKELKPYFGEIKLRNIYFSKYVLQ